MSSLSDLKKFSDAVTQLVIDTFGPVIEENVKLRGQVVLGKPSNQKKLGKQEVNSIRDLKRIGCSNKEIADVFDVHPSTVGRIVKGVYHR